MADSSTNEQLKLRMQQVGTGSVTDGSRVLYIMSRDQRVKDNHGLIAAQQHALAKDLPLSVVFLLYHASGHRAREHYQFMIDGLKQVGADLVKKNIDFTIIDTKGDTHKAAESVIDDAKPVAIYTDFSPLNGPRKLRKHIGSYATCPVFYVDTHNIVPVWIASDKQEIGARTLRPKIHKKINEFMIEPPRLKKHPHGTAHDHTDYAIIDKTVSLVESNGQKLTTKSGEKAAHAALNDFVDKRLKGYADKRNDPSEAHQSELSPYLHFGQLSALRIALTVEEHVAADSSLSSDSEAFLEELIVRRELSDNFCNYNHDYTSIKGAPQWAQNTLEKHHDDPREFVYTYEELRDAKTHDPAWNAAQLQLVQSGKMHGYMRMYWAKKVLEWTNTPETALRVLIKMNDHYSIDGGDPNGYVGMLWSVAGLHDRPWGERPIYGVVRSMVYNGLKRKFDIKAYESQWLS